VTRRVTNVALAVLLAGVVTATWFLRPSGKAGAEAPVGLPVRRAVAQGDAASQGPAAAGGSAPLMEFTRDGIAGMITEAVERVVRPGRACVALRQLGDGRWACILADGPGRYYDLDAGLSTDDFPGLDAQGFAPPPAPITRTTSIYRSVAKRAMSFDVGRGDRVIVLVCPREQWPGLELRWPPAESRSVEQGSDGG